MCWCSLLTLLLLGILLLLLFGPSTVTTTTPRPLPTCGVFQCPVNYIAKPGNSNLAGQDVTACCDKTCGGFTCAAGFTLKLQAATIRGFALNTCCDQKACDSFKCPVNYLPKPSSGGKVGQDINSCCDQTCAGFQCSAGYTQRTNLQLIRGRSQVLCCRQQNCGNFQCSAGTSLKANAMNIESQSQELCCNAPKKSCIVYGDPHSESFDGHHNDFYTTGEFWILKSNHLKVQGRYKPTHITRGLSVTKEVTISGDILQNHVLRFSATRVTYDGADILTNFPDSYKASGLVDIVYNDHGKILQPHRELGKDLKVLHLTFHDGTFIQINQWTNPEEGFFVNIMIETSPIPGMDGHCGNFNGDPEDDDRNAIRERMGVNGVAQEDLIGFKVKTPIAMAFEGYPTISECESHLLISAHARCQTEEHHFIPSMKCLAKKCHDSKGSLVAA